MYLVISAGMLHGLVFMDPKDFYIFLKSWGERKNFHKNSKVCNYRNN